MGAQAAVLVVEDEEVIRKILVTVLEDLGHRALEARDGEEAMVLMDSQRVDLLITDKNLPGVSGLDVMRKMRTAQPHAELMMVTGYASYESVLEALRLGACEYMEKPFLDLGSIQQRVQDAVERGRRRQVPSTPIELAQRLVDKLRSDESPPARTALPLAEQALKALTPR